MKTLFLGFALLCGSLLAPLAKAQTTVVAVPESDAHGYLFFRVDRIINVEGRWHHPLKIGTAVYPQTPTPAYPLGRFGEAAIIAFPHPDDLYFWQGVYVHNGYIPALNACAAKTLIRQLEQRANSPRTRPESANEKGPLKECPICHRIHLRT